MVEGVTRSSQRGLPKQIVQHEVKKASEIPKVKGTVKVAVLRNCAPLAESPLVAASVYDNKGVHFLSTCVEKIHWIEKEREVFDKKSKQMKVGKFLRLSVNDSYNNNMGNVDIADQLRLWYRPDPKWMRKTKWWWSIYFWIHGTALVNVYLTYKRFMEMNGRTPMSHYEFRKMIVLAKLCPEEYGAAKQRESVAFQRGDHRATARKLSSKRSVSSVASDDVTTRSAKQAKHTQPKKSEYVTVGRLDTATSAFNDKRLDCSVRHLPLPCIRTGNKGHCCSLCRWATGKKLSSQLLKCSDCKSVLCAWCYQTFHTVAFFDESMKAKIAKEVLDRQKMKNTASKKKS
jgi:hypothetical protein